jgi:hypothetical protein
LKQRCQAAVAEHRRLDGRLADIRAEDARLRETLSDLNALTAALKQKATQPKRRAVLPPPSVRAVFVDEDDDE